MDLEAFLLEFVGIVRATWTEIPPMSQRPRQFYTSVQALRESFVEQLRVGDQNAGQGIKLPCVVIDLGNDEHDQQWGVTGKTRRARVAVYYVAPEGTPQTVIHAKLVALMNAVEARDQAGTLTTFQAPEGYPRIDSGPESDVNRNLVGESAVRVSSGHLEYSPGILLPA